MKNKNSWPSVLKIDLYKIIIIIMESIYIALFHIFVLKAL